MKFILKILIAPMLSPEVVQWGADGFSSCLRQKLQDNLVFSEEHLCNKYPNYFNILLLGPAGAGKSSLIYSWWRSLQHKEEADQETSLHSNFEGDQNERNQIHGDHVDHVVCTTQQELIEKLSMGWKLDYHDVNNEIPKELDAMAMHGTQGLRRFIIQEKKHVRAGISVMDTKGLTYFNKQEIVRSEFLVHGCEEENNENVKSFEYWLMLSKLAIKEQLHSNLNAIPHTVVMVFDVTLRSFSHMLNLSPSEWNTNDYINCFKKVAEYGARSGYTIFAALTHSDKYRGVYNEKDECLELNLGEKESIKARFSAIFGGQLGCCPVENVFVIENYRKDMQLRNGNIDFEVLKLLNQTIIASNAYIQKEMKQKREKCTLS